MSVRAYNAVEIEVDTLVYNGGPCISVTIKRPGTSKGAMRAYLDIDSASVLAAMVANHVDAARRG